MAVDWNSCPADAGPSRDKWTLDRFDAGETAYYWAPLTLTDGQGNTLVIKVLSDALKIGGVRMNVTAVVQQQIADRLGAMLLTPHVLDEMWRQRAVTVEPMPRQITSKTSAMIDQSAKLDAKLGLNAEQVPIDLCVSTCKTWVVTNLLVSHPGKAANYGWHFDDPHRTNPNMGKIKGSFKGIDGFQDASNDTGVSVIQPLATAHAPSHVDYSQDCLLMLRAGELNGQTVDLAQIVMDPTWAHLLSAEGALKTWRQPGVPDDGSVPPGGDLPTGGNPDSPTGGADDSGAQGSSGMSTAGKVFGVALFAGVGIGIGVALSGLGENHGVVVGPLDAPHAAALALVGCRARGGSGLGA